MLKFLTRSKEDEYDSSFQTSVLFLIPKSMKIPRRWFSRSNFVLSHLRTATAVTLISAAAAMAFVASGDRVFTVSSPPSQLQDRLVISKIAGERDAESTSART